ncbi:MAG: methyltransferase, partial [Lachnospiraceae bacterium]|nr:methyltransferase [Lachnospiraceae bacterium]
MAEFTVTIKNQTLSFTTNEKVFSPRALDSGTAAMLSVAEFMPDDKVLDLGCGYGAVGILAAKLTPFGQVTMCDISEDALALSWQNAQKNNIPVAGYQPVGGFDFDVLKQNTIPHQSETSPVFGNFLHIQKSDGFSLISDKDYTKILTNPPYHTDFSVAKGFIEDGFSHLAAGGIMYMV